ncbi:MAG TPA: hypothetical protein VMT62_17785, partial [Syntrophorhabdaceae bacterium]|nr:hypothetical protein [Syntrophorhabdaceae bacterium]
MKKISAVDQEERQRDVFNDVLTSLSLIGKSGMGDMSQKRILVPTRSVTDWKMLFAEPDKQWKPGYSAMIT